MEFGELQNSVILIVDDQPKNLDVLISSLEGYGFDFLVAQSGTKALKRAAQVKPDMVLLDILMPEMDGFEVCKRLKAMADFKDIPIIFMSALTETVDKLKGFELGAVDYITKPFQLDEIIARIKTHLTIASLQKKLNDANLSLEEKVYQRTVELQNEVEERSKLEQKYRLLVDTLQEGVWALDANGKTSYINPRMAKMLGYSIQEIIEKPIEYFIPNELKNIALKRLESRNTDSDFFDFELIHKAGQRIYVSMASSPMIDDNGEFYGFLIAIADISQRKKAEIELLTKERVLQEGNKLLSQRNDKITKINDELLIAKEKAEESDRLKSAFLANLSHEIRTPMNAIVGFAELLKMNSASENSKKQYIDMIVSGTIQLKDIITDIIEISKIEANQQTVSIGDVNIFELVGNAFDQLTDELNLARKTRQVNASILIPDELNGLVVRSDLERLHDIFKKLIKNAVKFTEKGKIEIACKKESNFLIFSVSDTGIGIATEAQEFIFEQFRQVEETFTREFGGTGLGLPISKGFIEQLGGGLWLKSSLGNGATFFFSIPYHEIGQQQESKLENIQEHHAIWKTKTVLVAEDEEINIIYLEEILTGLSIKYYIAKNGKEAIDLFSKHMNIDLVLMDLKMPIINGFDALKEIKKIRNVPVIAQTAYAMAEDEERTIKAGFDAYLPKPIKPQTLIQMIERFILA